MFSINVSSERLVLRLLILSVCLIKIVTADGTTIFNSSNISCEKKCLNSVENQPDKKRSITTNEKRLLKVLSMTDKISKMFSEKYCEIKQIYQ